MIALFNRLFGGLFALLLYPFERMSAWVGMLVVSVLTALLMLAVYRYTSNQKAIRTVKDRIKAHLLELRLYKDNLAVTFRAQGRLLLNNAKYLGHNLRPMLVMIIPLILILIQLDLHFGYRGLQRGETALLKVRLKEGTRPTSLPASLEAPAGLSVDSPPLRIDTEREIDWRVRGEAPGMHDLLLRIGGETITKRVAVDTPPLARISPARVRPAFLDQILNPGEPAIASASAVEAVELVYPASRLSLLGWPVHWLVAYFVLSIVFGFALKGLLGVEI